jgi:hypothetical protein
LCFGFNRAPLFFGGASRGFLLGLPAGGFDFVTATLELLLGASEFFFFPAEVFGDSFSAFPGVLN